ncbi:biotin transporter BioY [Maritimibacter sp. HL-12]|uniref:biotin transporter BioY n=1 Tax=Maritimibacter sp. HL-12 TaxID=1162418 RepID=UPI000A0F3645|nr:biotin transporter BioY [Maritimibacter sp. HL-12]SMH29637.1 biotin transport system substrate-specific component [Maritimibacter sp. HL-12]
MAVTMNKVLGEAFGPQTGAARAAKDVALVLGGIALLTLAAKIRVPMWPVPITMQTFAVLALGAGLGLRLGLVSVLGYLALGAAGFAVFTGEGAGLAYIAGPTGGFLAGFALAAAAMGLLARRGWDKTVLGMAGAMLIGTAIIYTVGLGWMAHLFAAEHGLAWVFEKGMLPFLPGDALKLVLAALVVPGLWKLAR